MSIRDDLTINWTVSPRIIEVAAPSTLITIQDLYDTVRNLAAQPEAIDEAEIIDAGGKEILSEQELICLTVTLFDAKIKFEERTSWTVCEIIGGNLVAVDTNGDSINPIEPSPYVNVDRAKSSSGTLVQSADITAIKTKTENLPDHPADETSVQVVLERIGIPTTPDIAGDLDEIDSKLELVKVKTDTIEWADITLIRQVEEGRWKIKDNQMIFYASDNVTEIARFNLYDKDGQPAMRGVMERRRV